MSDCLNEVKLIGALAADPEVRQTQDGRSICNLRVATTSSWKDRSTGELKSKTDYHMVAIFRQDLVDVARRSLKKDSRLFVQGALKTRKWQDSSGTDRYTTEVVVQGLEDHLIPHNSVAVQSENRGSPPQSRPNPSQAPRNNLAARQLQKTNWDDEPIGDDIPFT